jgi:hypothetical protein
VENVGDKTETATKKRAREDPEGAAGVSD